MKHINDKYYPKGHRMTPKQILFSALILSTISNVGLAIENNSTQSIPFDTTAPALRFVHHIEQDDNGYNRPTITSTSIALMNKAILNRFEEISEENGFVRSIKCQLSIKGLPSEISLYNPKNPYLNENQFNPCQLLEKELLAFSPENFKLVAQYLSAAQ